MPFIAALGYDVFNPIEVIPEFTADVGIKKNEKVDYVFSLTILWLGFSLKNRLSSDRKSTRLNSSHVKRSRMPSSA